MLGASKYKPELIRRSSKKKNCNVQEIARRNWAFKSLAKKMKFRTTHRDGLHHKSFEILGSTRGSVCKLPPYSRYLLDMSSFYAT